MCCCLMHFYFDHYAEDILSSFERWKKEEPLPDSAPKKVSIMGFICFISSICNFILHCTYMFLSISTVKVYSFTPDLQFIAFACAVFFRNSILNKKKFLTFVSVFSHIKNRWYICTLKRDSKSGWNDIYSAASHQLDISGNLSLYHFTKMHCLFGKCRSH
jgi:hypothetical protein